MIEENSESLMQDRAVQNLFATCHNRTCRYSNVTIQYNHITGCHNATLTMMSVAMCPKF